MKAEFERVADAERGQGRRKRPAKAQSTGKAPREKVLTAVNGSNLKPEGRTTGAAPDRPPKPLTSRPVYSAKSRSPLRDSASAFARRGTACFSGPLARSSANAPLAELEVFGSSSKG